MSSTVVVDGQTDSRRTRPSKRQIADSRRQFVDWFGSNGWSPMRYQRQAWNAFLDGSSGLIHSTTGTGKTYAAWGGPLLEWMSTEDQACHRNRQDERPARRRARSPGLRVLWLTPLRALAEDTASSLLKPVNELGIPWSVETRTGDSSSTIRNRQRKKLPTALVTTPESLSLMLTRPEARDQLTDLRMVVVDEWHELLGSKRGVQTELALARLRHWFPDLQTWGLSATLGNLSEALRVLVGTGPGQRVPQLSRAGNECLIEGRQSRKLEIDCVIPSSIERFPWAGHLGLRTSRAVVEAMASARTTLVFTNTRSQTEIWYREILRLKPEWAGQLALHHGSIDHKSRTFVENSLRSGRLRGVVCTSSLDLGVDFSPVDRVLQIGSPKGVARLMQRAGRSGHDPGRVSRITCVPTHAMELIEAVAARDAVAARMIEPRNHYQRPVDVLAQHAVTLAVGGGFTRQQFATEVRTSSSYRDLTDGELDWVLDFVTRGGPALRAYPDYHKVVCENDRYVVRDRRIIRQHRMSIGTITSDSALTVKFLKGGRLGTIEESFLAKLAPGDRFSFAGRVLELVSVQDMTVWVRKARGGDAGRIPRWMGGRMPLSTELARSVRHRLEMAAGGQFNEPEMEAVRPLLEIQQRWSAIPTTDRLLIEHVHSREGFHLFFYPFAGRLVHEGLAAMVAWRLARRTPATFSMSVNDYGFELLSATRVDLDAAIADGLFDSHNLEDDIEQSLNAAEMGKRQFREVARIAGLVFQGYPGQHKTARQLQASSGLLYDVFDNYDPGNLLLEQARREVLERQFEHARLVKTLDEIEGLRVDQQICERFTPLSFPLMVGRLRERLSTESLTRRIERMQRSLDRAADQQA